MAALDDILKQPTGAKFHRADLHIHSFGGSHDVADATLTPDRIVATASKEGLDVVAIADHNEICNVEAALVAGDLLGIFVVPAVELSTAQGHLLCYLPSLDALRKFYAQISIMDSGKPNSRCQQSMLECLKLLGDLGGFGVLAHVDADSGLEGVMPGGSPHKADILCHRALLGVELRSATSIISYSASDPDGERARIGRERIDRLSLGSGQLLARVLNSDAHALDALGRNAKNDRKVTRYKMESPSFDALRVALQDADARVRIEDLIPPAIPRVLGVQFGGGFLSGQSIQFGPNLNCIIGGRGTGKSTTFEAVRCLSGEPSDSKVIDSEVWPNELTLFWEDAAGQQHTLKRPKDGALQNADDPETGPEVFDMDCFGQGEAARISMKAQSDPLALLEYLDRFVDLSEAVEAEVAAREELLALQTEIEKTEQNVALIPQYERLLNTTRQQLAALRKPEVKELIDLQREVATEREVRTQVAAKLQELKRDAAKTSPKIVVEQIRQLADPTKLAVGRSEFSSIVAGTAALETAITRGETEIKSGVAAFESLVGAQITGWKVKDAEAQRRIDAKRRELEAMNVRFDMSYINKLATDEATHQQSVTNLQTWKPHLVDLRAKRARALANRWVARDRVATLREAFGRKASATLREALSDVQVSLKYARNAHSPDGANLIIEAMGWRTNQQARAGWLVEQLTIPALLDAVKRKDAKPILQIKTPEGVEVFKADEAATIIERLGQPPVMFALERIELHDLPRLQVTKEIPDGKGGIRYVHRDFAKLSLGQQQSVLLALMLSADSSKPLIIDQPEDNLDGEFIYSTLVPVLRRAKERRQVIIVTHNANVAVLGDAELLIVMKAMNDRGGVTARGSIDHIETRDAACAILEGAREAFLRRAKMYGIETR